MMLTTDDGNAWFEDVVRKFGASSASSGDLKQAIRQRARELGGAQRADFERASAPFLQEAGTWRELEEACDVARGHRVVPGSTRRVPLRVLRADRSQDGKALVQLALWHYEDGEAVYGTHVLDGVDGTRVYWGEYTNDLVAATRAFEERVARGY